MMLGLIGVGKWGKNIVTTLEQIPEANLKYLCTKSIESLSEYSSKYEKLSDWRKLLEKPDLEAILIATPPETHAEIATACIEKGLPVFVEKPMVTNLADAQKLQALVRKKNGFLMVGFEYLFNDHINYLKAETEKGTFGKILSVSYEHFLSPARNDVDIFWDVAPHPLSIFQYLFDPQKLISSEGKITLDKASVKMNFENAPLFQITASSSGKEKIRKLTIVGEKITALLNEAQTENKLSLTQNGKTSYPKINSSAPLKNELEHFIHCIKTSTTPLTNVNFGCQITEWLETISKK